MIHYQLSGGEHFSPMGGRRVVLVVLRLVVFGSWCCPRRVGRPARLRAHMHITPGRGHSRGGQWRASGQPALGRWDVDTSAMTSSPLAGVSTA